MEKIGVKEFWSAISILSRNYHAVNKRIFECVIGKIFRVTKNIERLYECSYEDIDSNLMLEELVKNGIQSCFQRQEEEDPCEGYLIYYKLLTKKGTENVMAKGVIDFAKRTYTCKFQSTLDDFAIQLDDGKITVDILSSRTDVEISSRWAENVLKAKLIKWAQSQLLVDNNIKPQIQSIQLVDSEAYNNLYKDLKKKYAEKVLKFWQDAQESTDPLKFIYEDLAIASYLITLWRKYAKPKAFADLGCGNGLLVYILNEEGYAGYGFDIRARKLWSLYPKSTSTNLIEQPIKPHAFKPPVEVDWLVGNHSDELSPWVPVLAATANYEMQYFLLPCCSYEFSGSKFQRRTSNKSVYQDFFAYAEHISHTCGFITLQDRLKIPSTKRLALIGVERTYTKSEQQNKEKQIKQFVRDEIENHGNVGEDIKLREKHEAVRNCTQICRVIIEALVLKIFHMLLFTKANIIDPNASEWKVGGRLSLQEIANQLSKTDLQQIKSECGGIKTLLRNKHEIFEFYPENLIGLRKPKLRISTDKNKPMPTKRRHCFFKQHHPDGCPLTNEQCTFLH